MDYREYFIVKDLNTGWGSHLDPYDKKAMENDRERAQRIKAMLPAYFIVTLPAHLAGYEIKPNGMTWDEYNRTIKAKKPKTEHMSMTFFRIKDYVPMSRTVGFFTAPKCIPPSLKLETLDGRQIEGYAEYIMDGKQHVVLSDAVLGEVSKNFVHKKLSLNNFANFSVTYVVGDESHHRRYDMHFCTKQQAANAYADWKANRQSLTEHFDHIFDYQAKQRREENERAQQQKARADRNISQFEKDFGGW